MAAIKFTHALHLIFVFIKFCSYRIIIHLYRRNSSDILSVSQLKLEIEKIRIITRLLLCENNSQQWSYGTSDLLDLKFTSIDLLAEYLENYVDIDE